MDVDYIPAKNRTAKEFYQLSCSHGDPRSCIDYFNIIKDNDNDNKNE